METAPDTANLIEKTDKVLLIDNRNIRMIVDLAKEK